MNKDRGLRSMAIVVAVLFLLVLPRESLGVEVKATTVTRDANGCTVHVTIQVGVEGTDAEVTAVKNALEACFNVACTIPCVRAPACQVVVTVDVKKWSTIPPGDQGKYHHAKIVANDGNPSLTFSGAPNGASGSGDWRTGRSAAEYCHEALHLCGLPDQYCGNHIGIKPWKEPTCPVPPNPLACPCMVPPGADRCTSPCLGHANDIMAALEGTLDCTHILAIVTAGGLNSCPEVPCCPVPTGGSAITPWGLALAAALLLLFGIVILRRMAAARG